MKKIISLFLSLTMLLSLTAGLDFSAYAETVKGECGDNTTYTFDSSTGLLTISGKGECYAPYSLVSEIKSVAILDGITSIDDCAFCDCTSLTSVTIPNSVTSIGEYAFCDCTSLTSVTIPDSVTSIGYSTFGYCTSLTSVTIPDSVTSIGKYAFENCESLISITIPNGVTSIGECAFYYCASLTSVTIPNSVTSIGDYAFYDCTSLTSVTIPDSVTSIGEYAFGSCESLAVAVILGNNVSIDSSAFYSGTLLLCKSSTKLKDKEGFVSQKIKYFDDISIVNDFSKFNNKTKKLYGGEDWNEDNVVYRFTANESRTYYSNSNIVFDEDFNLVKSKKIDRINDSTSRNQSESEGYSFQLVKGKKYYFMNGIVIKDFVYCSDEKQYVGFDYNNYCKLKVIYPDDKSVDFNYSTYKENLEQTQKAQFCGKIISFDLNNPVSFDSFEVLNSECIDSVFLTALKKFDQKTLGKYPVIYRLHLTDGTVYDVKNYTMQCVAGETTPDGNSYSSWYCFTSDGKKIDVEFEYDNNCSDNLVIYIDDCGKDPYYKLNPSTVVNVNEHVHKWINGTIIKQATCTDNGEKCYTCSICNATKTELIKKTGHTYKQSVTPATTSKDGKIVKKCSVCGATVTSSIAKISSVSLSAVNYTYNGGVKTPSVTVKDSKGKKLSKGKDYTVSYSSGRKNVGRYTVKIKLKGNYSGTVTKTFDIVPKGTSIKKISASKKGFKVYWKAQKKNTTGYEIQYSTAKSFKNAKTVKVSKNSATSQSVAKLSGKKKYFVRVRTYKTVKFDGKKCKVYSSWSNPKTVVTKK
ncbi:MAG: leucine-rich repeat domain-containing protein [Oscillospiraceae bacterium]|nr:leucine-rich repeat domain-containing protein [Oscillospiraceae bacterium]